MKWVKRPASFFIYVQFSKNISLGVYVALYIDLVSRYTLVSMNFAVFVIEGTTI